MSAGFVRMVGARSFAQAVHPVHPVRPVRPLGATHSVVVRRVQQPRCIEMLQQ
ncbi:hypothetical protein [Ralstonia solanacearum]|uniref:hypothetical protein n=1 Tax=Ralstonia solanacearum TaxID=305 RepID=UPI0018D16AB8|nr:hypothetical protein [Ralstonia solanacearum]